MNLSFRNLLLLTVCCICLTDIGYSSVSNGCLCKLQGEIDDCSCKVENVDSFNNKKIFPRLKSLLVKDFFKYFKLNLKRECPFWTDDSRCALKDCHVKPCTEEQLPEGLKGDINNNNNSNKKSTGNKYSKESQQEDGCDKESNKLGELDTTLSEASKEAFKNWSAHDDAQNNFCEIDDDTSPELEYVDLLLNPERYTGYVGTSAHRIWRSIYQENCFQPQIEKSHVYAPQKGRMCLEKRTFYRMVSGLHTSINIHLSANYMFKASNGYGSPTWGHNVEEFITRFDPETTQGLGPQRLKNLYFTYLVELRALAKAAPYLMQELFYTGDEKEDIEIRQGVTELLDIIKTFPDHFDESKLFQDQTKEMQNLKEEFRNHFLNISRIMDCVGCDKCKLWGKLQVTGMGTALKILFSGDDMGPSSIVTAHNKDGFQLRRTEIVALFNAFGRLSSSIRHLEEFRQMLEIK